MDHVGRFESLIAEMKLEGRYRTFIELERLAGGFPTALWRKPEVAPRREEGTCSSHGSF